ncbi:right-handed parallel beta-helix repeat-containing protein [Methylobacterium sp. WL7]|uniref:right-handed parallel beta-helix repeat-containing protein n=1 Tax=Methylobacterium sp. WL7 TaxID=2603900 RepID=UPI0011CCB278|nr:right-handed parallel beta-helix repeat-containing protein [Methylobacterium sp. WL7]TXN38903.1 hypothetical protein FV233_28690 [Methylobacterium sp. WL7]
MADPLLLSLATATLDAVSGKLDPTGDGSGLSGIAKAADIAGKLDKTGDASGASATPPGGASSRGIGDWLAATHFNVASVAALRAWPVGSLLSGAIVRTSGYYATADGGGAEYVWSPASSVADDGCMAIAPTSGTGRWLRQIPSGSDLSLLSCGVKADFSFVSGTGTDNTAAIQAAITAAQSAASGGQGFRIKAPPGYMLHGPVLIASQVEIDGAGSQSSVFVLKSSAATAALTIQTAGSDFTSQGYPAANIKLTGFRIMGQAGKGGNAGGHGIEFANGTIPAWVRATDITLTNLPGSGLHANGFPGFAEFTRSVFVNNNLYGTDTGSTADWRFVNCDWGANTAGNLRSQYDAQMLLINPNISGAGGYGAEISQSDIKVVGGSADLNNKSGIKYTANPNGIYRLVLTGGFSFGGNSRTAVNTYHDIEVYGSGSGLLISGVRFSHKPYVQDATSNITNNIFIDPSSTVPITENSNQFASGSLVSPGVTNAPNRFGAAFTTYTPSMVASGATTFVSGATSGRYQIAGKRLDFSVSGTITTSGNGTTWVAIALPGTLKPAAAGTVTGFGSNGKVLSGQMIAGTGFVFFRNADGTYPGADGLTITASGTVEIQ